jgi:hypothetical protein
MVTGRLLILNASPAAPASDRRRRECDDEARDGGCRKGAGRKLDRGTPNSRREVAAPATGFASANFRQHSRLLADFVAEVR